MKKLRKFGAAVILTFALITFAVAGQVETPPCANPAPGQVETPPCAAAPADMGTATSSSTTSAGLNTPAVAHETSFSKIAADILLNLLPLF
ncbi:MAG: hypothetical protein QOH41_3373 [Blastocatellia bacterium]|jgi:hypothetical protein|nr:hypothetical protein [Blastocatellia bacterium]